MTDYDIPVYGTLEVSEEVTADNLVAMLQGVLPPSSATGNTGDYYADTDSGIFYGPKSDELWGAEQHPVIASSPLGAVSNCEHACRYTFARAGQVIRIRYQTTAGAADTLTFTVWNSVGTLIATVTDTQTAAGTYEVTLPTPVPIPAGSTWTFSMGAVGEVPTWGASEQAVTNTEDITFLLYRRSSTFGTFPNSSNLSASYYVEPIYEPGIDPWPVTVDVPAANSLLPTGGTTGQVLTKDTATDYDVSWAAAAGCSPSDHHYVVEDTFTRADSASTPGSPPTPTFHPYAWTPTGTWGISGNGLYHPSGGFNTCLLECTSGAGLYEVTIGTGASSPFWCVIRSGTNGYIMFGHDAANVGRYQVIHYNGSTYNGMYQSLTVTPANGDVIKAYLFRVVGNFLITVNGVRLYASFVSNLADQTMHGFACDNATVRFDSFRFTVWSQVTGHLLASLVIIGFTGACLVILIGTLR